MDDREDRIRAHAYRLWQEEGCPPGRSEIHWDMATELVAIEDNQMLATKPNPLGHPDNRGDFGEPVEPLQPAGSMGDVPALTDQGEEAQLPEPSRAAVKPAKPLSTKTKAAPKAKPAAKAPTVKTTTRKAAPKK